MKKLFPIKFFESLKGLKGFDEDAFLSIHLSDEEVVSIRLNPAKQISDFDSCEKIPWCENGKYLNERPSFTSDPLFHAGCYYVQEASSMFIEQIFKNGVDLKSPLKILDLCAAPGGKSTLIASLISDESVLISNEVIKTRVSTLKENLVKWGSENIFISNNDPKDFSRLENYFDVILVDAPCSGSGLFRKNNNAVDEWSEENVSLCSHRQQRILADIIPALKENGILIYSTCSYSVQENETICDWVSQEFKLETIKIPLHKEWGIVETASEKKNCFGYRFYPDKIKGEGFFVAAFKKPTQTPSNERKDKGAQEREVDKKEKTILEKWIQNSENYFFLKLENEIIAIREEHEKVYSELRSTLYLKKAGVTIGEIIRDELIPSHELAMSNLLKENIFKFNVDKETALRYLKKENISVSDSPKGWILICYKNHPLGWAKNLGSRINNYYPKNYRILKEISEF